MSAFLRGLHEENKLLPPRLVAQYLWQLLNRIDPKTFSRTNWDLLQSIDEAPLNPIDTNKTISTKPTESDSLSLRNKLSGSVWDVGSTGYSARRHVFNRAISHFPYAIVVPESDVDIINTIDYANRLNLQISVKGGGHGVTGAAVIDGGIVLDMSAFQSIELCAVGQSVRVGAGVKNHNLDLFLSKYKKVIPDSQPR